MSPVLLFLDNLGGGEVFIIVLVILLFFGSKRIPELARTLGKGMRELRDATNGIQREIQQSANEITKEAKDVTKELEE
jgi:sec-independent protein translocase protein TatA